MALTYRSGEDIRLGDRVTYGGNAGTIELVAEGLTGDPESDWLLESHGAGIMVAEPKVFGRVYINDPHEPATRSINTCSMAQRPRLWPHRRQCQQDNWRARFSMNTSSQHERHMRRCIELARQAIASGDTPVGSLILVGDELVSEGVEAVRARPDATAHAEMEALRTAFARRRSRDLSGCTLYTSVEPCIMCAYAMRLARISVVVCGARGGDEEQAISGYIVLTDARVAPNRPPPLVIRDVLKQECEMARDEPRG